MKKLLGSLVALSLVGSGCTAPSAVGLINFSGPVSQAVDVDDTGAAEIHIGPIDEAAAAVFIQELAIIQATGTERLVVRITSPGGSVFAGIAMADALQEVSKTMQVECRGDYFVASMATYMLASPGCDVRTVTSRTALLYHAPSTQARGTSRDLEQQVEFLNALSESMAAVITHRSRLSIDEYLKRIDGRDWTITARDALAFGFVDAVVAFD